MSEKSIVAAVRVRAGNLEPDFLHDLLWFTRPAPQECEQLRAEGFDAVVEVGGEHCASRVFVRENGSGPALLCLTQKKDEPLRKVDATPLQYVQPR